MQHDVSKGVALITGSAQGIGKGIALRLASDGFDIALNDIPSKSEQLKGVQSEIHKIGRKCEVFPADISEESAIKGMIEDTVKSLGSLDVLVANAGITVLKPLTETSTEDLDRILAVNARAPFLCYKYAALQMISQGRGGRIIGASSIAGKQAYPNAAAYSTTKFAVRGLTQSGALELAKYGITVNAYAPGAIDTEMLTKVYPENADANTIAAIRAEYAKFAPVQRLGEVGDIAGLVSYLASKESSFITGQSISINGGAFFD